MESFKDMVNELLPNLKVNKSNWTQYFKNHPQLSELFIKYPNISDDVIATSFADLNRYIEEKSNCQQCKGIEGCPNLLEGHYTSLDVQFGQIQSKLIACRKLVQKEREAKNKVMFKSQYIPSDVLTASFKDITPTLGREDALTGILEFCKSYEPGQKKKGLYLYGPLGVGKSYMMVAAAKKLAEKGISTLMVYVPDFFREMKNSIHDHSLNEKMDVLKKVEVLILDDMGAETISQWERDEILGAILQARMVNGYPTLYTSNLDYDALEEHLAYSYKGGEEKLKAKRIMERIRHYTAPYFVDGKNQRVQD